MELAVFQYHNTPITFQTGNDVMINATEMAKTFGKQPIFWLNNQQTKDFLSELSKLRNLSFADLVIVRKGNPELGGGTWMHEDVALEFARWLHPAFAIWCNDRIKELMRHGVTATQEMTEKILGDPDFLIEALTKLKKERKMREQLQERTQLQEREIKAIAPKAEYYDNVLQSSSVYLTDQIAKELGLTAVTLNRKLKEMGVQFRRNGQWVLRAEHTGKGYTKTRTYVFTRRDGSQGTNLQTVWTEKGREFIHKIINN